MHKSKPDAHWQNCPIRNQMWVHVAGFSIMGGVGGLTPHQPKLWLIPPCFPKSPTQFCRKNADFALFMQFLAVLA